MATTYTIIGMDYTSLGITVKAQATGTAEELFDEYNERDNFYNKFGIPDLLILSTSNGSSVTFNKEIFKNSFNECHSSLHKLNLNNDDYNNLIFIVANYYRLSMTREIKNFVSNMCKTDDLEDLTKFEASLCEALEDIGFQLKIKYTK